MLFSKGLNTIKKSLKRFVGLFLIGQIFLVGAILQTDSTTYSDVPDYSNETDSYEMVTPRKKLTEFESVGETKTKTKKVKFKEATITSVSFKKGNPFSHVELALSENVKIYKKNQGGKLLRIRIMPTLKMLSNDIKRELEERFTKFSIYRTDKYTELVFAAYGRLGNPYIAESKANSKFKLLIPYREVYSDFPIHSGKRIEDGLTYYRDRVPVEKGRRTDVHILRVEPLTNALKVFPVLANEGICQKEVLSSMAKRYNAVAAINGAYFTSRGDPIGTLIINHRLVSSPLYKRSVFGITKDDGIVFGNPDFKGILKSDRVTMHIDAVNQPRHGDQLVIYTPEYAESTLTTERGLELILVKGKVVGIHSRDALIPPDGVVVSAGGAKVQELEHVRLGEKVNLDYSIDKPWNVIKHAVCGGPRLVLNGKRDINGKEERFSNSIIYGRHPRTAVALTFDGDLLFIVVDGRTKRNAGMKLKELANYLVKLGARQAINLDGGGSSSMIIKGRIVNHPSDGGERRISNGILITKR